MPERLLRAGHASVLVALLGELLREQLGDAADEVETPLVARYRILAAEIKATRDEEDAALDRWRESLERRARGESPLSVRRPPG